MYQEQAGKKWSDEKPFRFVAVDSDLCNLHWSGRLTLKERRHIWNSMVSRAELRPTSIRLRSQV
jgi:hypothetical protein